MMNTNALVLAKTNSEEMTYTPGHIGTHIPADLAELSEYAQLFVQSGMFVESRDIAKAAVKIMRGAELGLTPFAAMDGLHIIQGRITMSAGVMTMLVDASPDHDYLIVDVEDETKTCIIEFYVRNAGGQMVKKGTSTFTIEEARKAGLIKPGSNWEKWPADMLFARAMSRGFRRFCSRLASGATPYTPEEIRAGDVIETSFVPQAEQPAQQTTTATATETKTAAKTAAKKEPDPVIAVQKAVAAKIGQLLAVDRVTATMATALYGNLTGDTITKESPIEMWQSYEARLTELIADVTSAGHTFGSDEWHAAVSIAVGREVSSLSALAEGDWTKLRYWLQTGEIVTTPEEPSDEDEPLA